MRILTPFREFHGTYERYKAEALARHCRELADMASRAAKLSPVDKRWLTLQEWEEPTSDYCPRAGQWLSDVEVEWLA